MTAHQDKLTFIRIDEAYIDDPQPLTSLTQFMRPQSGHVAVQVAHVWEFRGSDGKRREGSAGVTLTREEARKLHDWLGIVMGERGR